ncbi:roadblock/LC7 domain-containing protein (plasmid) [Streptomyces sp. R39]|uniref:Roadblock/LC7 domain-containing protein n=1 Tax=Streptomyces sp. R39 TaxID=3238631 RepID=A0AB39R1X1_9ACTN
MSENMASQSASSDLTWLLDGFKDRISGIDTVLVVTTDGLPSHTCTGLGREDAEQLAAITSGTYGLMRGLDTRYLGAAVRQIVAQLDTRAYFVTEAAENSLLAVIAHLGADAGQVGHEMVLLANQVRSHLGNPSRAESTAG